MRSFIKKYSDAIFCLLAPLIAVLLSKYKLKDRKK